MTLEEGLIALLAAGGRRSCSSWAWRRPSMADRRDGPDAARPLRPAGAASARRAELEHRARPTRPAAQASAPRAVHGRRERPSARGAPARAPARARVDLRRPLVQPRPSRSPICPLASRRIGREPTPRRPRAGSTALGRSSARWRSQQDQRQHVAASSRPRCRIVEAGRARRRGPSPPSLRAALWTLVGVSRHAWAISRAPRRRLDAAVRAAPDGVSEGCPQRIVAWRRRRRASSWQRPMPCRPTSGERVAVLRMAVLLARVARSSPAPGHRGRAVLARPRAGRVWDGYAHGGERADAAAAVLPRARELVRRGASTAGAPAGGGDRAPLRGDWTARMQSIRAGGRLPRRDRPEALEEPDWKAVTDASTDSRARRSERSGLEAA